MKRLLFILMCFSAIFAGRAQTFSVDDLEYTVTDAVKFEVSVKANSKSIEGEVIIPESVTYMSEQYSVTSIGYEAFEYCYELNSITIPNTVTTIGDYSFLDCSKLTSITLSNSTTYIGDGAFGSCTGLTSITIPNSVTSIGQLAFVYCIGLSSIIIPNSVTELGDRAFLDCTGLSSITIPSSVTYIGSSIFSGCRNLTKIEVDENNSYYSSVDGVLFDKNITLLHTFPAGSNVSEYGIPNSVNTILFEAFYECENLTSINIPYSVKTIDIGAFSGCKNLTSINIPYSVTSIEQSTFYACMGLNSITIPNSVTTIGALAFQYCSELTFITIPNSVTLIKENAFQNSGITYISINNPIPPTLEQYPFSISNGITVRVPIKLVETYKAAEGWKDLNIVGVIAQYLANGASDATLKYDANTMSGIQFDIEAPEGVELSVCEEAAALMTISKSEIAGGKTRYVAYTKNGELLPVEFILNATATDAKRGMLKITNIIASVNDEPVGEDNIAIPVLGYPLEGLTLDDVEEKYIGYLSVPADLKNIENLSIAWMPYISDLGTLTEDGIFAATAEGTITDLPLQINDPYVSAPLDATAILNIKLLMGDVNRSGAIDIADVVSVVNYILMRDPDPFDFKRADLDANGDINIADLTRLVKLVLAQPKAVVAHIRMRARTAEDEMSLSVLPACESADGKRHVYVHLDTDREYTAMQVDLETTGGARIEAIHAGAGIDSHVMDYAAIAPATTRVLLYSHSLAALPAGEHIIDVTIADSNADASLDAELIATSAISADADGQAYNHAEASAYIGDIPTGINSAYSDTMIITTASGQIFVTSPADATVSVIDLQGRVLATWTGNGNASLPRGLYIVTATNCRPTKVEVK